MIKKLTLLFRPNFSMENLPINYILNRNSLVLLKLILLKYAPTTIIIRTIIIYIITIRATIKQNFILLFLLLLLLQLRLQIIFLPRFIMYMNNKNLLNFFTLIGSRELVHRLLIQLNWIISKTLLLVQITISYSLKTRTVLLIKLYI